MAIPNPTGYWALNEAGGTDTAANGVSGGPGLALLAGTPTVVAGKAGNARSFPAATADPYNELRQGADSAALVMNGTRDFSVSFWLKTSTAIPIATDNSQNVVRRATDASFRTGVGGAAGQTAEWMFGLSREGPSANVLLYFRMATYDGSGSYGWLPDSATGTQPTFAASNTDWHHVLIRYDAGTKTARMRLDGGSDYVMDFSSRTFTNTGGSACRLTVGGLAVATGVVVVDELAVWASDSDGGGYIDDAAAGEVYNSGAGAFWDGDSWELPDTTPPTMSSRAVAVAGTTITATLSESGCVADGGGTSGTGGFTLANSGGPTITGWSISGTTITFTLSAAITGAASGITMTYARSGTTDDIKDAAGNYLADFSAQAVTNNSQEPTPALSTRTVPSAGSTVVVTLSTSGCTPSSGTGGFSLSGTSATVSSWAVSGTTLTLTLSGLIYSGETVTLTYDRSTTTDDIAGPYGAFLANVSGLSVDNGSAQSATVVAGTASAVYTGPAVIRVTATDASGGTAPYTYQWQRATGTGGSFSDLSGATSRTNQDDSTVSGGTTYRYRLRYTDGASATAVSNELTLVAAANTGGGAGGGARAFLGF